MKTRPFTRIFLLFLVPLSVPVLILGLLNVNLVSRIMTDTVDDNTRSELNHTRANIDLLFQELETVALLADDSQSLMPVFETIFQRDRLGYEELKALTLVTGVLTSQALAKPYIHSVIVYYRNDALMYYSTETGKTTIGPAERAGWYREYASRTAEDLYWVSPAVSAGLAPQRLVQIGKALSSRDGMVAINLNPRFVERLFGEWSVFPGQCLFVVDEKRNVLFSNANATVLGASGQWVTDGTNRLTRHGIAYRQSALPLERGGLSLISLIPEAELYRVPIGSLQATGWLLALSLAFGVFLTLTMVRYNYSHVETITGLLRAYAKGLPPPPLDKRADPVYGPMVRDILSAFMEKEVLANRSRLLELEARQYQINPHFLFNTLKTLYWRSLGLTGGENPVSAMTEDLSELLQYALDDPGQLVSLAEEEQISQVYLRIQGVRYQGRFAFRWSVPQELRPAWVPRLILQPLLENCFSHAARDDAPVAVFIRVRSRGPVLEIMVADRGPGLDPLALEDVRTAATTGNPSSAMVRQGIGVPNTVSRLRLHFGPMADILIRSKQGLGFSIRLRFPIRMPD